MEELEQKEWADKLEKCHNAVILDVRTPQEWAEGVIPGAKQIDILNPNLFMGEIEKLDKNIPYFIYCRSGVRSGNACRVMDQMEFKETYNLLGGILEWEGEIKK